MGLVVLMYSMLNINLMDKSKVAIKAFQPSFTKFHFHMFICVFGVLTTGGCLHVLWPVQLLPEPPQIRALPRR